MDLRRSVKASLTEAKSASSIGLLWARKKGLSWQGIENTNCRCGTSITLDETLALLASRYFLPQLGQILEWHENPTMRKSPHSGHS